jgi:beta-N-acetylhexosaminidase
MIIRLFIFIFIILSSFTSIAQSLETRIGQMIIMGIPGNKVDTNSQFFKDVKAGNIGGIVVYEHTLTPTNSAENLTGLIKTYQQAAPTPLFVAITQEGGMVNRLKEKYGFPPMPSAQYLGRLDNVDSTKWYADNTAFTLSRLGINVNFAPVVDIYSPTNPVLGSRERTYSDDVRVIAKHAAIVIASHRYFHVATAVKHFPGHGSSTEDSHLGLTDVSRTWNPHEVGPYTLLLKQKMVDAVMTAHIVNTQLDTSKLPATLSKKMIDGMLRKRLKFNGVVFSDDMGMKAISAEYKVKDAVALAINAGVDVLLFSGTTGEVRSGADLVKMIMELVNEKRISEKRIDESYQRIMKMKKNLYSP